jgi:hypothetical protein
MNHQELIQLLTDSGFDLGWALSGDTLILWEHEANPPAPLVRPKATDETPSPA